MIWRAFGKYGIKQRLCLDLGESNFECDWIHAPSLGENKTLMAWLKVQIAKGFFPRPVVITYQRENVSRLWDDFLQQNPSLKDRLTHRLVPLDHVPSLNRFLMHFRVKRWICFESDFWPLTLQALNQRNISKIWWAARLSPTAYNRYKFIAKSLRSLWGDSIIVARSKTDQIRLQSLFDRDVDVTLDPKITMSLTSSLNETRSITLSKSKRIISMVSIHLSEYPSLKNGVQGFLDDGFQIVCFPRKLKEVNKLQKRFTHIMAKNELTVVYTVSELEDAIQRQIPMVLVAFIGAVDQVLSRSNFAVVGGGWRKSPELHNIFEPIAYDIPVVVAGRIHPWECEVEELESLGLFQSAIRLEYSSDFVNANLDPEILRTKYTQYRFSKEKELRQGDEITLKLLG